jgi:Cys-rich four helix bundle protein (predicted Tat secretion target)
VLRRCCAAPLLRFCAAALSDNQRSLIPQESPVNRRSFIASSAVATVTATALTATVAQAQKAAPPPGAPSGAAPASGAHGEVVAATQKCIAAAYVCREMCVATLAKGDTMMAACMRTVSDMIPLCDAVAQLAASKSKHLKKTVAACIDACVDCEAECKKHEKMHAECKACLEACTACIAACKKVA